MFLLALSPNVYSWFLQLNEDTPGIPQDEAMQVAQLLNKYGAVPKIKRDIAIEPIGNFEVIVKDKNKDKEPMKSSQFAQSPWSLHDLQCTLCGNTGHTAIMCSEAPDADFDFDLGPRCFCCGQYGHTTIWCPAANKSPSPMHMSSQAAESQQSSSNTVPRKSSPWSIVKPDVGPLTSVNPSTFTLTPVKPDGPTKVDPNP